MVRLIPFLLLLSNLCAFRLNTHQQIQNDKNSLLSDSKISLYSYNPNICNVKATINPIKFIIKAMKSMLISLTLLSNPYISFADDELAQYAAQGNEVGVDGQCFIKKCGFETSACANDPNCLKGLSCLARLEYPCTFT